jgi:hypothetical protein
VRAFFQSLSLASASALVAVVSAVAAFLVARISSALARWCAAMLLPHVLSYCVYWMPVWLGADSSEYFSWEILGVGVPYLAGLVASVLVTLITTLYANRRA